MKKTLLALLLIIGFQWANAQLTIYANYNLQGTSATCVARTIYIGSSIPNGLNNGIKSISLAQGFMATIAENEDGTGERFTYMAHTSNINVNLAFVLQDKVSFIRVLRIPAIQIKKKGSGNTNNAYTADLNVTWFYDWGFNDNSTATREFAPMAWGRSHASDVNINTVINKDTITQYLAFNEPDHDGQANMYVNESLPLYKKLLRAGLRMGSPACTESQYRTWLDSFATELRKENLKFDFVCIHWYDWGNWLATNNANPSGTDVFNRFKSHIEAVYDFFKKPIWITEFNANLNRPAAVQEAFMRLALPWLDTYAPVERYAYFFGNDVPMYVSGTSGPLTAPASYYASHSSTNAYTENIYDTRPAFPTTVLAAWDPSTQTQGGNTVTNFAPTTINANITAPLALTRGSGLDLPTSTASNGYWGANNWSVTTAAAGVSASKFFRCSLKSRNGKSVNYHSIDKFNVRMNSGGPIKIQIDYQLNNGAFDSITTVSVPTRVTANYQLGPINLSSIIGLQNVSPANTITFRFTGFDANSTAGSLLFGSGTTDTDPDLSFIGGFSDENIILPISLTQFQLQPQANKLLLQWQTQQEVNFSHFVVEKSTNGIHFNAIATVAGINSTNGGKYSYVDDVIASNAIYYRLKMIDKDGSFSYSTVLKHSIDALAKKIQAEILPSVNNGVFTTRITTTKQENIIIQVVNQAGSVVHKQSPMVINGSISKLVDISNKPNGMYYVQIITVDDVETKKIVKQ